MRIVRWENPWLPVEPKPLSQQDREAWARMNEAQRDKYVSMKVAGDMESANRYAREILSSSRVTSGEPDELYRKLAEQEKRIARLEKALWGEERPEV